MILNVGQPIPLSGIPWYAPAFLPLIPILPLVGFLVILTITWRRPRFSGYAAILFIGAAFVLSLLALAVAVAVAGSGGGRPGPLPINGVQYPWLRLGSTTFSLGYLFDPLAATMLVVVTLVSLLVQIYSQGYMAGDPAYSRYFAYMCLFTFSMLGIVLAPNFLQLYLFWELVGVSSYLLIGFWWRRPSASAAAMKAFITTRVGDLGFLIGILILFATTHSLDFDRIAAAARGGSLSGGVLTAAMLLVFLGAVGKSAQFPLQTWLPDAMEGPTPVSALIHAATMVAAGVYLVARAFPLFSASPTAMLVVAWIGGFTALFAATMGLVSTDIKRVLAFSTISQLGYMFLGLGVGSLTAGTFHLVSHAFFKALLFLAAGSVIHGTITTRQPHGEQDLRYLGGLIHRLPLTAWTFLFGALALAAIPPFSGFWSKDEVVAATYDSGNPVLFLFAVVTAGLTAFYIFRAWILTFLGERRLNPQPDPVDSGSGPDTDPAAAVGPSWNDHGHPDLEPGAAHEAPLNMAFPLVVLAALALLFGLLGSPLFGGDFQTFIGGPGAGGAVNLPLATLSTGVGLLGILIAWGYYGGHWFSAEATTRALRPLHTLLINRYYLDDVYDWAAGTAAVRLGDGLAWFDRNAVDGLVNGAAWLVYGVVGRGLSRAETGRLPNYALAFFVGLVIVAGLLVGLPRAR